MLMSLTINARGKKLTSKATLLSPQRLALAGFVECESSCPDKARRRRIFVKPEINELIAGRTPSNPEFPCGEADFEIGKFAKGHIVGVSRRYSGKGELKILSDLPEAWAFCFRRPSPGWRMFGRFAQKNIFVGFNCIPREQAGDMVRYNQCAVAMISEWELLFPGVEPFKGTDFEDYLGSMVVER